MQFLSHRVLKRSYSSRRDHQGAAVPYGQVFVRGLERKAILRKSRTGYSNSGIALSAAGLFLCGLLCHACTHGKQR